MVAFSQKEAMFVKSNNAVVLCEVSSSGRSSAKILTETHMKRNSEFLYSRRLLSVMHGFQREFNFRRCLLTVKCL